MCDCIKLTNEKLAMMDVELDTGFRIDMKAGKTYDFVRIPTVRCDGNKRKKTMSFIPTFCPFCGEKQPLGQTWEKAS